MAGLLPIPSVNPGKISIARASIWTLRNRIKQAKKESQTASSDPGHFSNSRLFLAEERENLLSGFFLRIMLWLEMIIAQQAGEDPIFFLAFLKLISAVGLGVTAFVIGYPLFPSLITGAFFITASPIAIASAITSLIVLGAGVYLFLQSMREFAYWAKPKETEEKVDLSAASAAARPKKRSTLQQFRLSWAFWLLSALASLVVGAAALYLIIPLLAQLSLSIMTLITLPLFLAGLVSGIFFIRRFYLNFSVSYRLYQEGRLRKAGKTSYAYILENGKLELMPFFPNQERQADLTNLLFIRQGQERLSAKQIQQLEQANALSLFETFHELRATDKIAGVAGQGLAAAGRVAKKVLASAPEPLELGERKDDANIAAAKHSKEARLYQTQMLLKDLFANNAALLKFLGNSSLKGNPENYVQFARNLLRNYPSSAQAEASGKQGETTIRVYETIELVGAARELSIEEQRILSKIIAKTENSEKEAREAEKPKAKKYKKEKVRAEEVEQETGTIGPALFEEEIKAQCDDELTRASENQHETIKAKYSAFKNFLLPNGEARGSLSYRRHRKVNPSEQERGGQLTSSLRLVSTNIAGLKMLEDPRYRILILKVLDAADARLRKENKTDAEYMQNFKTAALEMLLAYNVAVLEAIYPKHAAGIDANTPALTAFIDNLVARTVATNRPAEDLGGYRVDEEDPDAALKVAYRMIGNPSRRIGTTTRLSAENITTINKSRKFNDTVGLDNKVTALGRLSQLQAIFEGKEEKSANAEEDQLRQAVVFDCLLGSSEAFKSLKDYSDDDFAEFLRLLKELLQLEAYSPTSILKLALTPDRLLSIEAFKGTVGSFRKTYHEDALRDRLSALIDRVAPKEASPKKKAAKALHAQATPQQEIRQKIRAALKDTLLHAAVIAALNQYSEEDLRGFRTALGQFLNREDVRNNPQAIRDVITPENLKSLHSFQLKALAAGEVAGTYNYYLSEGRVVMRIPNDPAPSIKEGRLFLITLKQELDKGLIDLINTKKFKPLLEMLSAFPSDPKKNQITNKMIDRLLVVLLASPSEIISMLQAEDYNAAKIKEFTGLLERYLKVSAITLANTREEDREALLKTYINPENIKNLASNLEQFEDTIKRLEKGNVKDKVSKKVEEQEVKQLEQAQNVAAEAAVPEQAPAAPKTYDYYLLSSGNKLKVVLGKPGNQDVTELQFLSAHQAQLDMDLMSLINTSKFRPLLTVFISFLSDQKQNPMIKKKVNELLVTLLTAPSAIMTAFLIKTDGANAREQYDPAKIGEFAGLLKRYLESVTTMAFAKNVQNDEDREALLAQQINSETIQAYASDLGALKVYIATFEAAKASKDRRQESKSSPGSRFEFWPSKPKAYPSKEPLISQQVVSLRLQSLSPRLRAAKMIKPTH